MVEKTRQLRLTESAGIKVPPSYEEIIEKHSGEFDRHLSPPGDTFFGFWMQTLADLELLDLELQGLQDFTLWVSKC